MNVKTGFYLPLLALFFSILVSFPATSQLCAGSLGDPVVNVTFGQNNTSSAYAQNYTYVSSSCPNDGSYTITNQTVGCFGSWHSVLSDHTGGGNFMLVNASFAPGDFYLDTVGGLCPNTTYEFAAWVMNVFNRPGGILPNITFTIERTDGSVLATYHSGDISGTNAPEWKQHGFYFTTPATEARIVLRMKNNAPGGIGNDIALDDITFRPCGSLITIDIEDRPEDIIHICEGDVSDFKFIGAAPSGYVHTVYYWQLSLDSGKTWRDIAGANTLAHQHKTSEAGSYWYRLTVTESTNAGLKVCRIASNVLAIVVHPHPVVNAGPDKVVIKGNSLTLAGSAKGEEIVFNWSPITYMRNARVEKPEVAPDKDIWYTISATSKYGCYNYDSVFVKVVDGIFVPNAFTPNGDGKNDLWQLPFLDPSLAAEVSVFNRHGQLVYHSIGNIISWDGKVKGKLQSSGVYVYLIKFGQTQFKGTLTIIR